MVYQSVKLRRMKTSEDIEAAKWKVQSAKQRFLDETGEDWREDLFMKRRLSSLKTGTAWSQHKKLVFDALKSQIAQVRMMKTRRAGKSDILEAEKRLEKLKKIFWEDTEIGEWSKVRVEGPTVLTKNAVIGNQMGVETKELLKQYKKEQVIR